MLPTRLLHIDRIAEGVVTPVISKGTRGNYCALSYCWGTSQHKTTAQTRIADHQNGIEIEELPQVFKDAIRITHEIGLRYLWVDSLCIIQDDAEDWEVEAGRDVMHFEGYSATCQVLECLPQGETQLDDYETAVLDTVQWRAKELHSMILLESDITEVVGFAAPDADSLDKVTVIFIAECNRDYIQKRR
ncbi:hypothetical protein MRS44_005636 [Fusarium solani]|uniref:uncharacterized protein n=1 Tax=Fusarium solani TaxID=169388 RepID=UPI0032C41D48|nr:hypothetical protein MRS44_005636 [Fusarium solani]